MGATPEKLEKKTLKGQGLTRPTAPPGEKKKMQLHGKQVPPAQCKHRYDRKIEKNAVL